VRGKKGCNVNVIRAKHVIGMQNMLAIQPDIGNGRQSPKLEHHLLTNFGQRRSKSATVPPIACVYIGRMREIPLLVLLQCRDDGARDDGSKPAVFYMLQLLWVLICTGSG